MIHANELRIGNFLYGENKTVASVITMRLINGSYTVHAKYIEPIVLTPDEELITIEVPLVNFEHIPLTEEWLVRGFGFYFGTNTGKYHLPDVPISKDGSSFFFRYDNGSIHVKYVHQLQNLYYALTGTELTVKENATA